VRRRALDAAVELLGEGGLEAVTMRAVATRAGVTPPAVYWHFADKEALLADVTREARASFEDGLVEALTAPDAEGRLWRSIDVFRRFAVEQPGSFRLLFAGPPPGRPPRPTRGARSTIFQLLVDRVAECMKEGSLRAEDPHAIAMTITALAQGLVLLRQRGRFGSEAAFAKAYRASFEHLFTGLR
jgi:AcrR family transcriptional regulator